MKTVQIKKLAKIQMGYSFRTRLVPSASGDLAVIQMKDLLADNTVDCKHLTKIDMGPVKEHHLAQKGDLIFRSRGHTATSAILLETPARAVVSAPLLRIRVVNPAIILPAYLNWYIGQRDAQIFLTRHAKGTAQKMISKEAIEALEIAVPSLEKQKAIVALALLSAREQHLLQLLAHKRENYISKKLLHLAKGE